MCKGSKCLLWIKRRFEPCNFGIHKNLYGKPFKRDWVTKVFFLIQILLFLGGRWICYFWDIWLTIYRLSHAPSAGANTENISKANCFRVYQKLITWSTDAKGLLIRRQNLKGQPLKAQFIRHASVVPVWVSLLMFKQRKNKFLFCKICRFKRGKHARFTDRSSLPPTTGTPSIISKCKPCLCASCSWR